MKLSKLSIPYRAFSKITGFLLIVFIFGGTSIAQGGITGFILFTAMLLGILSVVTTYEYLYWRNFDYKISEDGFEIISGVFSREARDIPLRRIQNVDVRRTIFQRIVNLAVVHVETAGGDTTEADLRFVDYEKAKEIQKEIRELKNRRKQKEKEQTDDEENIEKEDFSLSTRNLAILSSVSIDYRAIAGYLVFIAFAGGYLGVGTQPDVPFLSTTTVIFFFATLSLVSIWVGGAISVFTKFYDFKLKFRDNALEYERGLLDRYSGTIPEEKIQNLIIEENFLKRMLGYATLKVETAGHSPTQQETQGSETAIPLAKRNDIIQMAEKIGEYQTPEINKINSKAKERYLHRYILLSTTLTIILTPLYLITDLGIAIYLLPLIILVTSKKASQLKWENIGYATGEKHIFTRKGFWKRKTYTVPYFRIQNIIRSQTIFQKRWGQNTLTMDTAGSILTNPQIIDMDQETAKDKEKTIFTKFKQSIY